MFTGIIRQTGTVTGVEHGPQRRVLTVDVGALAGRLAVGDSVNVDGVCLTATGISGTCIKFDVGAETLRLTTLGERQVGDAVNAEPSLRMGDAIGGHLVTGHVDGTGTITGKENLPGEVRFVVRADGHLTDQMVLKGSVAMDGISLTIAGLSTDSFEVSSIPHTLSVTTLRHKGVGDRVNIECDMMRRYVRRFLQQGEAMDVGGRLSVSDLEEQGF